MKLAALWFLLCLSPILLTGCWSAKELNESGLVAGVGFDCNRHKYVLTAQILQPGKLTPKAKGKSETAVFIASSTGKTVFQAIRNFPDHISRKLFWSHCRLFVIGRDLAKESVTQTLDWFYRNQELRPLSYVALAEHKAIDLRRIKTHLEPIPAYEFANAIDSLADMSNAPIVTLKDFMKWTASPIGAAYLPILSVHRKGELSISGTGVFLHDRLVGTLNTDESRSLLSLIGQVKSGTLVIPALEQHGTQSTNEFMTFEIMGAHTSKEVRVHFGNPTVIYHIHYVVDIADDPSRVAHTKQEYQALTLMSERQIKSQILTCIGQLKGYHADIIGAGDAIHRANPIVWHRLMQHWDEAFPKVSIQLDVSVLIRHEGLIQARY